MSLARLTTVVAILTLAGCGSGGVKEVSQPSRTPQPPSKPPAPKAAQALVTIPAGSGHLAAMARLRGMTLRDHPGGKVVAHLRPTTAWGSPTVLWAAERRGRWLGVYSTKLGNNRIAWV